MTFLLEVSILPYSVSVFHAFMLRDHDFNKLWNLNERSWNFETLGIGSKGPFLS